MSYDLNEVIIIGRLTRDPETGMSKSGKQIGKFSVANNRGKENTNFFNCVCFGQTAQALQSYAGKGVRVAITGTLNQTKWQDKATCQNRQSMEIVCNSVQILDYSNKTAAENIQQNGDSQFSDNSQFNNQNNYNPCVNEPF